MTWQHAAAFGKCMSVKEMIFIISCWHLCIGPKIKTKYQYKYVVPGITLQSFSSFLHLYPHLHLITFSCLKMCHETVVSHLKIVYRQNFSRVKNVSRANVWLNPHPVIRGLSGPGRHKNCHYLNFSLNLVLGYHVILKNVAWYHSWMFSYSVGELKSNYFQFNENCT